MSIPGLDLRVIFRSRIGTTIAWRTDILTPEQQANRRFFFRLSSTEPWTPAKVVAPPEIPPVVQARAEGNVGDTMVTHAINGPIKDDISYEIMAEFGKEPTVIQTTIMILPVGQVGGYIRPRRVEVEGKPVHSNPVYIAGISREAARDLAKAIAEQGLEVTPPDGKEVT